MNLKRLQYPIGEAIIPKEITQKKINEWIAIIAEFPQKMDKLTARLNISRLNTPYRKDGWTIRQVIHHCYDSHHNSYTRFKWALTEDNPIIKPYFEKSWAALDDAKLAPISLSILGLESLHAKWVYLLKVMSAADFDKCYIHPDTNEKVSLKKCTGLYAWHCQHHFAYIQRLVIEREWY